MKLTNTEIDQLLKRGATLRRKSWDDRKTLANEVVSVISCPNKSGIVDFWAGKRTLEDLQANDWEIVISPDAS